MHITLPIIRSPIEYCEPERLIEKTTGEGERRLDYIRHFPRLAQISPAPRYYGHTRLGSSKTSMPEHCYIVKRRTHAASLCACEREKKILLYVFVYQVCLSCVQISPSDRLADGLRVKLLFLSFSNNFI